jgi:hypothetical protein
MWKIAPIQSLSYIHIYKYIQSMFPKVGLLQETKRGGKEEKIIESEQ